MNFSNVYLEFMTLWYIILYIYTVHMHVKYINESLMGYFLLQELREIASHHKENDSFPADWGKQPYNVKKNRYRDIVPCK